MAAAQPTCTSSKSPGTGMPSMVRPAMETTDIPVIAASSAPPASAKARAMPSRRRATAARYFAYFLISACTSA